MNHNLSMAVSWCSKLETGYFSGNIEKKKFRTRLRSGWQIIDRGIIILLVPATLSDGEEPCQKNRQIFPGQNEGTTHLVEDAVCIFQRRKFSFAVPGDGTRENRTENGGTVEIASLDVVLLVRLESVAIFAFLHDSWEWLKMSLPQDFDY